MKSTSLLLFVAAVFAFHNSARAGPYTLEIVAEVGDVIDGRTIIQFSRDPAPVAINNDGEVAFFAKVSSAQGEGWSVMTQNRFIAGAGKLVDGRLPSFNDEDHGVDINNLGQVTYTAFLPEGGRGLFVDETLLVQPGDVIDGITVARIGRNPAINDGGTVAFQGGNAEFVAGWSIFTQDRLVVENGRVYDGNTMVSFQRPLINNAGEVVFRASVTQIGTDAALAPDRIIAIAGDVIDGVRVNHIDAIGSITDNGVVVMSVRGDSGPLNNELFNVTETQVLLAPGDVIDGLTLNDGIGSALMNNAGELAFIGGIMSEIGDDRHLVLFAKDRIIAAEGDLLGGKVMRRMRSRFDMNDRGDVVFRVQFEDLSRAVVIARAIPEPDGLMLAALAMMAFLCIGQRRLQRATRHDVCRRASGR